MGFKPPVKIMPKLRRRARFPAAGAWHTVNCDENLRTEL
jgi:hypothetical protein